MTFYAERQRFTQKWLWALLLGIAATFSYGAYQQLVLGRPWGPGPAGDLVVVASWLLAAVALPALFVLARLRTEVRRSGVCVRFVPFHLRDRCWSFEEIERAEAREYPAMKEYGGWGIRRGPEGRAYNVKGRHGVQLVLRTGKRVLIGTQDPEGLVAAIRLASGGKLGKAPPHPDGA